MGGLTGKPEVIGVARIVSGWTTIRSPRSFLACLTRSIRYLQTRIYGGLAVTLML